DTTLVSTLEDVMLTLCTDTETNFAGPIDNIQICSAPINGVASPSFLPCVDYTPNADYVGQDTMCVVSCSAGVCDTTIFVIDVTPVNDAPVALDDADVTTEDTPVTTDVIVNDSDVEGPLDSVSVAIVSQGTYGMAVSNGDGTVTYTPNTDFVGVDMYTYVVCDTNTVFLCDTATVTLTINGTPDTTMVATAEDVMLTVCTNTETNFAGPIDNIQICSAPINGVATPSFLPCVDYTPNADYVGLDTMCVISCSAGVCDTTIFVIDVTPVNDAPIAFDDVDVTTEDIPVTTDVIVNDSDVEGPLDSASIVILTQGTNGTAVSNGDGTATYTPNTDYVGVDVFTYEVCDTNAVALCNTATVTITINSAPDSSAISVIEDLGPVAICTDSLTNFGAATIDNQFICGNPSNGTLNTTFLPCIDYNPNPDFYGQDSFCIVTCAGAFCDTTYVAVTVVPVIDVPVLDAFANICETDPIPALTGTSEPGSIINWFDENDVLVGTGSPFTPPATLGVNCYSAIAVHAGLGLSSPDTAEVCFTIDSLPLNVSAGPDDTICGFQDYELQGTGTGNLTFWTQLVGQVVALDAADSNAIVSLEANNLPGTDNVYTFAWTNENGLCVVSDTVTIVVTEPHLTSAGNDTTICLTEAGGSVQLNATLTPGATGYWIYVGSESLTWSDSTDNQAIVDGLVPYNNPTSTYLFEWYEIIADCIAKDEVIITVNEAAGLDVLAADTFCLFTDYTLDATITGFSQASYSWRTDSITGPILSWDEDAIVSPLVNTTYYVVANVSFGQNFCSTIDSLELWVDGFPVSNDDGCYPLFEDSLLVGSTNDWLFNDDLTAVITGNVGFEVLDGGSRLDPASTIVIDNATDSYVYTPFSNMSGVDSAVIIAFNEACPHLRDTFTVCFNVIPVTDDPIVAMPDTVDVIAGTTVSISVLDNDTLDNEAVDTIITILLDPLFGSIDTPIINGQVVYNSETMYAEVDSFQYIVCQYLVDGEELCDTTTVILLVDGELYIPEGFTPNGDGVNDNFEIPNIELVYPNATMNIFNRWGDEVWNSKTPYRNNWTGLNFGDSQLPNGTYFYIVNLNNGSKRKIASYVVIYR
ncbi:MAG: gliding motility-associated-like protein, partial [Flavobacteriaceae bacterium]